MADGEGDIFSTNAGQLADELLAFASDLPAQIAPWSQMAVAQIKIKLEEHYGQRLAALWENAEITPPGAGELAHIQTAATSPYIMGYEFGTRPHDIVARNIALKFEKNGELFYRHMVHHPGTQGKHQSAELELAIEQTCSTEWTDALTTVMANLNGI